MSICAPARRAGLSQFKNKNEKEDHHYLLSRRQVNNVIKHKYCNVTNGNNVIKHKDWGPFIDLPLFVLPPLFFTSSASLSLSLSSSSLSLDEDGKCQRQRRRRRLERRRRCHLIERRRSLLPHSSTSSFLRIYEQFSSRKPSSISFSFLIRSSGFSSLSLSLFTLLNVFIVELDVRFRMIRIRLKHRRAFVEQ